jgi:hypothetical protein
MQQNFASFQSKMQPLSVHICPSKYQCCKFGIMIVIVIMSMCIQKTHRIPNKITTTMEDIHRMSIGDCAGFGVDLKLDLG